MRGKPFAETWVRFTNFSICTFIICTCCHCNLAELTLRMPKLSWVKTHWHTEGVILTMLINLRLSYYNEEVVWSRGTLWYYSSSCVMTVPYGQYFCLKLSQTRFLLNLMIAFSFIFQFVNKRFALSIYYLVLLKH